MRAKTVNIPKDFREELRKLQIMKQKIGIVDQQQQKGKESGGGDVVTVTTLGQRDSGGWPQQERQEIKEAVAQLHQQHERTPEEDKQSSDPSLYGPSMLHQNEINRARRQAEMDQLLTQLEGNLKKKSKSFHKRAHSSDRVMAIDPLNRNDNEHENN